MKKGLFAVLLAFCSIAGRAQSSDAASQPVSFIGFMAYNATWSDSGTPNPQAGYYAFTVGGNDDSLTPCGSTGYLGSTEVSATYRNNEALQVKVSGYWYKYSVSYSHMSTDSWEQTSSNDLGQSYEQGIASDLTYNYRDSKIYASTYYKIGNSSSGYLCTVDETTGAFTRIGETPFLSTIAAGADGKLWSIGGDGVLYSVNPTDASVTTIGATGYVPQEQNQSATFDLRTGKLYWAMTGFAADDTQHLNILCCIAEVDLTTGKATIVRDFGLDMRLSSLFIVDAHPEAPAAPADFTATAADGSALSGTATFTVPTTTYSGGALAGTISYTLTQDGETVATATAQPGEAVSVPLTFAASGNHNLALTLATAEGLESPKAKATLYVGNDTPAAPTNLQAAVDDMQRSVTLTWDAVTTGADGGYIDPASVTYTVTRLPENEIVARSLSANTFTDTPENNLRRIRYSVKAVYLRKQSTLAYSDYVLAGTSYEIPYTETFDAEDDYNTYVTIDANGDGSDDWEAPCWKYDNTYAAAFYYNTQEGDADDWLITPPIAFSAEKIYKLTFQTYGYYGQTAHLKISIGSQPTVEAMGEPLFDKEFVSSMTAVKTYSVYLAPTALTRYIGFHNVTTSIEHLSIDNVCVEEVGSNLVPMQPTGITTGGTVGAGTVSLTMPTLNARGEALTGDLSLVIYRGQSTTPAATLSAAPGEQITWTDEWAAAMSNTYRLVACNGAGEGIPAEASLDLSETAPAAVTSLTAQALSASVVRISWQPAEAEVGKAHLYSVYRRYDYENTLIAENLDQTEFTDVNATDALPVDLQQGEVSYVVCALNSAGEGTSATTANVAVGNAYTLPFAETWFQQSTQNNPWTIEGKGTASWIVEAYGYDPATAGQDGAGMVKFTVNSYSGAGTGTAAYVSPAIDFTSLKNPVATFYVYQHPDLSENLCVTLSMRDDEGNETALTDATFYGHAAEKGWLACKVDLSSFTARRGHLVFTGQGTVTNQSLHIDNLVISGEPFSTDVSIASLEAPNQLVCGQEYDITLRVANTGTSAATNARATLYVDGEAVGEESLGELAAGTTESLVFSIEPAKAGILALRAEVTADADEQPSNNSFEQSILVDDQPLAYVTTLSGEFNDSFSEVTLHWQRPWATTTAQRQTDDFEAYPDFAISGVGGWTLHDGDGQLPFTFTDSYGQTIDWPNNTSLQAFIVFNPSQTVLAGSIIPNSGEKSMVSFGSPFATNDDWLISPQLSGKEQIVSFYARGIDSQTASEKFEVLYAIDNEGAIASPADHFHPVSGSKPLTAGTSWTKYTFSLPAGATRFAIHYVGHQQYGLMVDDVCFNGYAAPTAEPDGYVILRDGKQINTRLVTDTTFTDVLPAALTASDNVTYEVCAVYGSLTAQPSAPYVMSTTGISSTTLGSAQWQARPIQGGIILSGLTDGAATIVAADGRVVCAHATDGNHRLDPGVYVVHSAGRSVKVVVR